MKDSTAAPLSAGAKLRAAIAAEKPLQVVGAINAYAARMAEATGFPRALSIRRRRRGELARPAGSRHQHDGRRAHRHPAHHRGERAAAARRCGHRLGRRVQHRAHRALVHQGRRRRHAHRRPGADASAAAIGPARKSCRAQEMVDRVKAAVDARTDAGFVIMARSDALAGSGSRRDASSAWSPASRPARTRCSPRRSPISRCIARCKRRGAGAGAREHHRVRQDASVYARGARRRSASTSCCTAARRIAR